MTNKWLAASTDDDVMSVFDIASSECRWRAKGRAGVPAASPDGKWIALLGMNLRSKATSIEVDSGGRGGRGMNENGMRGQRCTAFPHTPKSVLCD